MKYKSSWWLLILFLLLIGFVWYKFNNKQDKTSLIMADRDFAVKEIDKIEKIFLATRNMDPISLEKVNGVWMLNGKYKVATNPIKNLLETIRDIRMQSIPSKGHVKGIMEGISVFGIKVEIYGKDDENLKTYYIGGTTQQEYGTYFYMEHGSQPYIMEIPHFVGNVRERYDLDEFDWRDKTVFDVSFGSIAEVSLEYPFEPEKSFNIKKEADQYALYSNLNPDVKLQTTSANSIKKYLVNFEGVGAEDIQNIHPLRQEIVKLKPYCIIRIVQAGSSAAMTYNFHPITVDDSDKVIYEYDPNAPNMKRGNINRFHISRSDGDFLLVQYPNVRNILITKDELQRLQ